LATDNTKPAKKSLKRQKDEKANKDRKGLYRKNKRKLDRGEKNKDNV
jgi:hypothetical protein